ncbi:hypothetical protein Tco_0064824 [Tanacetum coccineum]
MDLVEFEAPEEAPQSQEQEPPSPNYVPGLEHPPLPDYVPGPEYPEYVALSDDEIPVEDQPLPADASPTTLSSGYVADSDLEEDPEEDPTDYPTEALIAEYASAPTPPSQPTSLLSPLSSPLPKIPSPPLLLPPPYTRPTYASAPLSYRATMVQLRAASPLPVPSPPLLLPSADHRSDIAETDMPF